MTERSETQSFVHRYVASEPPDAPTLLLLHGTGGNENDLVPLGQNLLPGAGLLSLRGKVLERGMPRFFRRLAEGVFDLEDLQLRTHELADWVVAAADEHGFDPSRVVAVGYSNGANMAASILLLRPGTLAGAVIFHGMVPIVPAEQPHLTDIPVLLTGGRHDPMVSPQGTEQLAALLSEAGANVTMHWEPGGHSLTPTEVAAAQSWMSSTFGRADSHTP